MATNAESPTEEQKPIKFLFCRHGILINRFFFLPLELYFKSKGYTVINRGYPSTKKSIEEHAKDLWIEVKEVVDPVREPYEIYFLTHSLGGLILRYALTHFDFPPVKRAVQLAPPNNGSIKARSLNRYSFFKSLAGSEAGQQLTEEPEGIFTECGIPQNVDLGIIAGVGSPMSFLQTPIPKPHDGVVSLEEARLPGVPLKEVESNHTTMLFNPTIWKTAHQFLETGSFGEVEVAVKEEAELETPAQVRAKEKELELVSGAS